MGNDSCLIEPQGVSAWLKETAQTPIFLLSLSLMLNLEPQSSKNRTLTTHNANRHFRVLFYTFVGQPLSKQLMLLPINRPLITMNITFIAKRQFAKQ